MTVTAKASAKTATKAVPEVRQCTDEEHWQFGSSAVAAGKNRWGIMSPDNGGHWGDDEEVKDWTVK